MPPPARATCNRIGNRTGGHAAAGGGFMRQITGTADMLRIDPAPPILRPAGGVAEWLKAHAWKVCIRGTVSRVRIPLPPPMRPGETLSVADSGAKKPAELRHFGRKLMTARLGQAAVFLSLGAVLSEPHDFGHLVRNS